MACRLERSLSDAEPRKDKSEDVVRMDRAGDVSERIEGGA
jgi:hypothetical protein